MVVVELRRKGVRMRAVVQGMLTSPSPRVVAPRAPRGNGSTRQRSLIDQSSPPPIEALDAGKMVVSGPCQFSCGPDDIAGKGQPCKASIACVFGAWPIPLGMGQSRRMGVPRDEVARFPSEISAVPIPHSAKIRKGRDWDWQKHHSCGSSPVDVSSCGGAEKGHRHS